MNMHQHEIDNDSDDYLISRPQAWFAFAMTFALMLFDYIDRQVIVSLFPYLKTQWMLSDKQLGGLVSIISLVVAVGSIPVALLADRVSRVKSVVAMATVWSMATTACMFTGTYGQLLAARALVGAGETGYGSVGAALIASIFPRRLRSPLLGAFFAAASLGSVLGVVLGGVIATRYGWKAAFGVVGVPGLMLALLYMFVRDYQTVELTPKLSKATRSPANLASHIGGTLLRTRTLLWVCLGAPMQLILVAAIWSWLPSFLNRYHGEAPDVAAKHAAVVVLCGAVGSVVWGWVVDRVARNKPSARLSAMAALCVLTLVIFMLAFGVAGSQSPAQFKLIMVGGFVMACTVGPVSAVIFDVVHPGLRSTGAAVLSLFQNLLGLAAGPFIAGMLSDWWGLNTALSIVPCFSLLAALFFLMAKRSYESDMNEVAHIKLRAPLETSVAAARVPA